MKNISNILQEDRGSRTVCPVCLSEGKRYGLTPPTDKTTIKEIFFCSRCSHKWVVNLQNDFLMLASEVEFRLASSTDFKWLLKYLPKILYSTESVSVLDIGCWDGALLNRLPQNWIRHGVEINPKASSIAKRRGVKVFNDSIESVSLPDSFYNLVLMMDLIEHLEDPIAVLEKVSKSIKNAGYILVLTGNSDSITSKIFRGRWYYCNYNEHLNFFTQHSLNRSMSKVNINAEKMYRVRHHTHELRFVCRQLFNYIFNKKDRGRMENLHLPYSILDRILLLTNRIINGRDHLMVIGQKKGTCQ